MASFSTPDFQTDQMMKKGEPERRFSRPQFHSQLIPAMPHRVLF